MSRSCQLQPPSQRAGPEHQHLPGRQLIGVFNWCLACASRLGHLLSCCTPRWAESQLLEHVAGALMLVTGLGEL